MYTTLCTCEKIGHVFFIVQFCESEQFENTLTSLTHFEPLNFTNLREAEPFEKSFVLSALSEPSDVTKFSEPPDFSQFHEVRRLEKFFVRLRVAFSNYPVSQSFFELSGFAELFRTVRFRGSFERSGFAELSEPPDFAQLFRDTQPFHQCVF